MVQRTKDYEAAVESETLLARKNGAVYTPDRLSDYLAEKTLQYILKDPTITNRRRISILDHACGYGVLLESMGRQLSVKAYPQHIIVCGIDINPRAIASCHQRLSASFGDSVELALINTNSLRPFGKTLLMEGWRLIFEEASTMDGFDILIANPPWGADIAKYKTQLDAEQFTTLQGQVDSFELFVELATKIVKTGGYFAFIVPDSILNHGKSNLRDLLIEATEIKFVARLGEKIFPGINRACVLIICRNSRPSGMNLVDCFRLSKKDRTMILEGKGSFSDVEAVNVHSVPQARFANNPYKQFDIDVRENETALIEKLRGGLKTLAEALSSTRGVELGSSGMICACNKCHTWAPLSEKQVIRCKGCGEQYDPRKARRTSIITEKGPPNSIPLILGKDLKRYVCPPSKRILTAKKGINYKPKETYDPPKILVRKTGVGVTAALDYTSAYTNQVVYILRSKCESGPALEFFIALLNSRVYYFLLVKSFGELEWRSHPYLTQSQILSLPLPDLELEANRRTAYQIVSLLRPVLKKGKPQKEIDLEVELLICKLFSLTKTDFETIYNALNESEQLLPVRELKSLNREDFLKRLDA